MAMGVNNALESFTRLHIALSALREDAKRYYPDLDELVTAARTVDPDVGWLDVATYLDGGEPTHFSEAIDNCGLPVHKRKIDRGQR